MMLCLVLLLTVSIAGVTPSTRHTRQTIGNYQTEPRRALVVPGGSVTILAKTGTPLEICHFYLPGSTGRLVDLSRGPTSVSTDHHEYFGAGLESGECGIRIKMAVDTDDGIVECKMKARGRGQWERSVTTLRVTDIPAQQLPVFSITPQRATLSSGDSLTVTCNADRPITLCHIYLPGGLFLNYDRGAGSDSTVDSRYHGTGLEDGQCGVTLTGVKPQLTGYVVCKVGQWPDDLSGPWETDALHITTTTKVIRFTPQPSDDILPVTLRPSTPPPVSATECHPLTSQTLLLSCSFAGEITDCSQPQDIGTTVALDCKPGFARAGNVFYERITCKRGGKWDKPLFSCNPDCGRRLTNVGVSLVSGGLESKVGEFPWHVGVYVRKGRTVTQTCGGTLISPRMVISAAHCFWDDANAQVKNAALYNVAAGKLTRQWEDITNVTQRRDVSHIFVPAKYRGRSTNYEADIAAVRVSKPFDVTPSVNIICIDWENQLEDRQLAPNIPGLITGWGYTESNRPSNVLMYVPLPYVATETCFSVLQPNQQQLFTSDKFCAGYVNKSTSVCGGDSGGGLVFKRADTGRYYLRGIVSIAFTAHSNTPMCHSQLYTGFIRFSSYREWVQDNMLF